MKLEIRINMFHVSILKQRVEMSMDHHEVVLIYHHFYAIYRMPNIMKSFLQKTN